jgi:hypothetical protein
MRLVVFHLNEVPVFHVKPVIHGTGFGFNYTIRTQEKIIKQLKKTTFMEPSLLKIGDKILESCLF